MLEAISYEGHFAINECKCYGHCMDILLHNMYTPIFETGKTPGQKNIYKL